MIVITGRVLSKGYQITSAACTICGHPSGNEGVLFIPDEILHTDQQTDDEALVEFVKRLCDRMSEKLDDG